MLGEPIKPHKWCISNAIKCTFKNMCAGGSVKDRIAKRMVES